MEGGRGMLLAFLLLTFLLSCAVRCEQTSQDIGECKVGGLSNELLTLLSSQPQPSTSYYRYRALLDCLQIELKHLRIRAYILYLDNSISKEKKKQSFLVILKQAARLLRIIKQQIKVVMEDKQLTKKQKKHFRFLLLFLSANSEELILEIKSFIQNVRPEHKTKQNVRKDEGQFENGLTREKGGHQHSLFHRWQQKLVSLYLNILNSFLDYLEIVIFMEESKEQEQILVNLKMSEFGCLNHVLCKDYKQVYSKQYAFSGAEYKFLIHKFAQIQAQIRIILEYFHFRFPRLPLIVLEQFYQPKQRVLPLTKLYPPNENKRQQSFKCLVQ